MKNITSKLTAVAVLAFIAFFGAASLAPCDNSEDMVIPAHSLSNKVHTGVRIALPENWVFFLDPRSSIGAKTGLRLSNSLGVIDEEYRGEVIVLYDNISDSDYEIKAGDRIAQGWPQPVYRFKAVVVDSLPDTERGEGGFGSTGK